MSAARRIRALGRAELTLLLRNRAALFSAIVLPLAMVAAVSGVPVDRGELSTMAFLVTAMLAFVLLSAVYYNLVTAYVSRREELVLKRLRAGELTDAEILAGVASPAVAVALAQSVLFVAAGAVFLGLPAPVNAPLLLLGVVGGVVVFVLLAAASSVFTRTTELAQITTLPILLGCLFGSGLMVPLEELPDPVAAALRALPLSPVVELMRLGWVGTAGERAPEDFAGAFGPAAVPVLVLVAWLAAGAMAIRYRFRWEPRR
ncbi:ABC transporter permease [Phytohabitans aurantiacus]|uniref:Transport permease protein n=1 Tax=Phytohabitans aurantiacus TaxID=3016789 RepID=A0ABQ5QXP3_9ACTN|nr:ABC transporter permease [Phytohabitans aurantiacus]GLH98686.1 transport permease protein [Phytohabitans aurantiacus]